MSQPPAGIKPTGVLAELARVNIKYLVEWRIGGEIYRALPLPLDPSELTIEQTAPVIITHTLGNLPIREIGRYKQRSVMISGSSGYAPRTGYNRLAEIISQRGDIITREFRIFLEDYQKEAEKHPQNISFTGELENHTDLIFRALDEDYNLQVEVDSFTFSRNANENNFSPAWSVSFNAYMDAEEVDRPFESFQSAVDAVTGAIDLAGAGVAVASEAINGVAGLGRMLLRPLDALANVTSALDSLSEGLRDILDLPSDLMNRMSNTALSLRTTATRLKGDVERFPDSMSAQVKALERAIFGAEEAQLQIESVIGSTGLQVQDENLDNPALYPAPPPNDEESTASPSEAQSAVTPYRIRQGETLKDVARRVFNDADRWTELADLNGWIDAYRLPSGRLARAGDLILVPSEQEREPQRRGLDPYGTDLLIKNGDLVLSNDDLVLVRDSKNVEQALKHRLKTVVNESSLFKRYGLPNIIGRRVSSNLIGLVTAHTREQVLLDSRVDSIPVIEMKDDGDTIIMILDIITKAGGFLQTSIPLSEVE